MRSTVFAAAAGSVVALVGFAGAANASATIDLIWADTGTDTISNVNTSLAITLQVILTAGPNGSQGGSVSIDYSAALGNLTVLGFANTPGGAALPFAFDRTTDTGSRIEGINAFCLPIIGLFPCLAAGQSHQLGTVTFHKSRLLNGIFEIRSGANGPNDDVLDIDGNVITATTTFNSAFLVNVSEPDFDGDGVADNLDNCSVRVNPDQVDTDADDCGNVCDADYNQSGIVDIGDFGAFAQMFGCFCALCVECICECELYQHTPPIGPGQSISIADFGFFSQNFNTNPGPSGTTAGTLQCP